MDQPHFYSQKINAVLFRVVAFAEIVFRHSCRKIELTYGGNIQKTTFAFNIGSFHYHPTTSMS